MTHLKYVVINEIQIRDELCLGKADLSQEMCLNQSWLNKMPKRELRMNANLKYVEVSSIMLDVDKIM